jgi:uncharacterized membrane protein YccC
MSIALGQNFPSSATSLWIMTGHALSQSAKRKQAHQAKDAKMQLTLEALHKIKKNQKSSRSPLSRLPGSMVLAENLSCVLPRIGYP